VALRGFSVFSVNIQLTFSSLFCSWTWPTATRWRSTRSRSAADQSIFYDDISQYYIHTFLSLSPRELVVSVTRIACIFGSYLGVLFTSTVSWQGIRWCLVRIVGVFGVG
jgi:hypothetical protein